MLAYAYCNRTNLKKIGLVTQEVTNIFNIKK
jgi:hypothetical protein